MKARDIIPGWPRGKSTSPPWPILPYYPAIVTLTQSCDLGDLILMDWERRSDRAYHEEQQIMVDEWRKGTYRGFPIDSTLA
jgi:hypothetical protein